MSSKIPERYNHLEVESKCRKFWEDLGIYRWDPKIPREKTFVVDTPPPTASGALHIGHVFSYTQTDVIVRYQRMRGKNIFYPMGWDDNGLPTERRVQNYYGIRCNPKVPYDSNWNPQHVQDEKAPVREVSRKNFIEACGILTKLDEEVFEETFRSLALSVDWSLQYATIDNHCQKISQLSFLDLVEKGELYNAEFPTVWDVDFQSAIAQAEIEDREIPGAFHDIRFGVEGGGEFIISTTRPELLAACIAVVAHPSDKRYKHLFGKRAITPLFYAPVPIEPSEHADPEKGSGILMVCTFGDIMDVQWWRKSGLPSKQVIGLDGRIIAHKYGEGPFTTVDRDTAETNYLKIVGKTVKEAKKIMAELLAGEGSDVSKKEKALVGEPKAITHPVKFYEKGQRPLEFIPTRQWYIKILEHKGEFIEQGKKVAWHPDHMRHRYDHWVEGLNQDWCISRQRYFGVPFPVWYPLDQNGQAKFDKPIYAAQSALPVDPSTDVAPGYKEEQRGKPGGFAADPDVMDTWATSALTPQIMSYWLVDPKRHEFLFPMDLRPQGHDIIRTWAFSSIAKAYLHEKKIPWKHAAISGFIMDPDRKKMSKSKGNVITPQGLLKEHSSDAVRYWASRARLGMDTPFDGTLFKIGMKLATKIFNASRFVIMQFERCGQNPNAFTTRDITDELDRALVEKLNGIISHSTAAFDNFDYSSALLVSEDAFWSFCDHYLELVKARAYSDNDSPERRSALATLAWSLRTFIRLFAPVVPFVTEEVWSWSFAKDGEPSVHSAPWPTLAETKVVKPPSTAKVLEAALEVIGRIRARKTEEQKGLKWKVSSLTIKGPELHLTALKLALNDVIAAGNVAAEDVKLLDGAAPSDALFNVSVELAKVSE